LTDDLAQGESADIPAANTTTTTAAPTAAPAHPHPANGTQTPLAAFCRRVVNKINSVRQHPSQFAAELAQYTNPVNWVANPSCDDAVNPKCMFLRSDGTKFLTHEGVNAINAAITALNAMQATGGVPALSVVDGLCQSAAILVTDQGSAGGIGHMGPRGSSALSRTSTYGKFSHISEIVQYGSFLGDGTVQTGPFDVVAQLVVGDGDSTRAHFHQMTSSQWRFAGADMGNHLMYSKMSCIVFTSDFTPV